MLIKFAGIKKQFAIGMRWAVDDRKGIENIQFNTGLNYGIISDLKEKGSKRFKLVALGDETHKNAICLSSLLASQYENLILIHRISDAAYWVCVIKNHTVWTGIDVPKSTAGDFVGSLISVSEVVEHAKAEFSADGIDLDSVMMSTETASDDFREIKIIDFHDFISKLKKSRAHIVRYLEPSKILLRKIIILVFLIIAGISVFYYIQQQRLITRLIHQQQIEEERQRKLAIEARINYFSNIQSDLRDQYGALVLRNVLTLLQQLPLQSFGWTLTRAFYNTKNPNSMTVYLNRSEYGTLNSFLSAYSPSPTNGNVDTSNNSGTKVLNFPQINLQKNSLIVSEKDLIVDIPKQAYRLISYMQLNQTLFQFTMKSKQKSQYNVSSMTFSVHGDELWKLIQLAKVFESFPTLKVMSVDFIVNDYNMSWTVEGEVYA